MSRVVIVARTRMHGGHLCIGGHDLDDGFRGVRLLDRFGGYWMADAPFMVGETWELRYRPKASARPPHVEDAYVNAQERIGKIQDLRTLVLQRGRLWKGSLNAVFEGTVCTTPGGSAYIPSGGRLPRCSTGYWVPGEGLTKSVRGSRVRFSLADHSTEEHLPWVGVEAPPAVIPEGSLVRVSLTRLFGAENVPEGYYVQISGVLA